MIGCKASSITSFREPGLLITVYAGFLPLLAGRWNSVIVKWRYRSDKTAVGCGRAGAMIDSRGYLLEEMRLAIPRPSATAGLADSQTCVGPHHVYARISQSIRRLLTAHAN